jgi:hypothetical protein
MMLHDAAAANDSQSQFLWRISSKRLDAAQRG